MILRLVLGFYFICFINCNSGESDLGETNNVPQNSQNCAKCNCTEASTLPETSSLSSQLRDKVIASDENDKSSDDAKIVKTRSTEEEEVQGNIDNSTGKDELLRSPSATLSSELVFPPPGDEPYSTGEDEPLRSPSTSSKLSEEAVLLPPEDIPYSTAEVEHLRSPSTSITLSYKPVLLPPDDITYSTAEDERLRPPLIPSTLSYEAVLLPPDDLTYNYQSPSLHINEPVLDHANLYVNVVDNVINNEMQQKLSNFNTYTTTATESEDCLPKITVTYIIKEILLFVKQHPHTLDLIINEIEDEINEKPPLFWFQDGVKNDIKSVLIRISQLNRFNQQPNVIPECPASVVKFLEIRPDILSELQKHPQCMHVLFGCGSEIVHRENYQSYCKNIKALLEEPKPYDRYRPNAYLHPKFPEAFETIDTEETKPYLEKTETIFIGEPEYTEEPAPVYIGHSEFIDTEKRKPLYIEKPESIYPKDSQPYIRPFNNVVPENLKPTYIEKPEPIYVERPEPIYIDKTESFYVQPTKLIETEKRKPTYVEHEPIVDQSKPNYIEQPEPYYIEQPQPIYIEYPKPNYIEQPEPVYIERPESIYLKEWQPYIRPFNHVVSENLKPTYIEKPEPIYVKKPEPIYIDETESLYVHPIKLIETEKRKPTYVEHEPINIEELETIHFKFQPIFVDQPKPNYIEQPEPNYIEQPEPNYIGKPEPNYIEPPQPNYIEKPQPNYIEKPESIYPKELQPYVRPFNNVVSENLKPTYVEKPEPIYVERPEPIYIDEVESFYVQPTKLIETEKRKPTYVEHEPINIEELETIHFKFQPIFVDQPKPNYIEQPEPNYIEQPEPNYIGKPEPSYIEPLQPNYIEQPQPNYIEKPESIYPKELQSYVRPFNNVVSENLKPTYVEEPEPIYVERPKPIYIDETESLYVQPIKLIETEKRKPTYVEHEPINIEELETIHFKFQPIFVDQPKPNYIEQPDPNYIEQPEPNYIGKPESNYIEPPQPNYIEQPQPNYIEKPESIYPRELQPYVRPFNNVVSENLKPTHVEKPEPLYVERPEPIYIDEVESFYVQPTKLIETEKRKPTYYVEHEPIVDQSNPNYIEQPEPNYIEQPQPNYIEHPKPNYIEHPEPVYIERPESIYLKESQPDIRPFNHVVSENLKPTYYVEKPEPIYIDEVESFYVQPTKLIETEKRKPTYVEHEPIVHQSEPNYIEQPEPNYIEQPEPNSIEKSEPNYIEKPEPNYIEQPKPNYTEPIYINQPVSISIDVEEPKSIYVQNSKPDVGAENPESIYVPQSNPIYIETPKPVYFKETEPSKESEPIDNVGPESIYIEELRPGITKETIHTVETVPDTNKISNSMKIVTLIEEDLVDSRAVKVLRDLLNNNENNILTPSQVEKLQILIKPNKEGLIPQKNIDIASILVHLDVVKFLTPSSIDIIFSLIPNEIENVDVRSIEIIHEILFQKYLTIQDINHLLSFLREGSTGREQNKHLDFVLIILKNIAHAPTLINKLLKLSENHDITQSKYVDVILYLHKKRLLTYKLLEVLISLVTQETIGYVDPRIVNDMFLLLEPYKDNDPNIVIDVHNILYPEYIITPNINTKEVPENLKDLLNYLTNSGTSQLANDQVPDTEPLQTDYSWQGNNQPEDQERLQTNLLNKILEWERNNESPPKPQAQDYGFIELTYRLKQHKPLLYHPVYYVKYKMPMVDFMTKVQELLATNPQLTANPAKLLQELIVDGNVSAISPNLQGVPKEDILRLTFNDGNLIQTKVFDDKSLNLNEQIQIIHNLNSDITPQEILEQNKINAAQYYTNVQRSGPSQVKMGAMSILRNIGNIGRSLANKFKDSSSQGVNTLNQSQGFNAAQYYTNVQRSVPNQVNMGTMTRIRSIGNIGRLLGNNFKDSSSQGVNMLNHSKGISNAQYYTNLQRSVPSQVYMDTMSSLRSIGNIGRSLETKFKDGSSQRVNTFYQSQGLIYKTPAIKTIRRLTSPLLVHSGDLVEKITDNKDSRTEKLR